jgi:hypothetical protein
MDSARDLIDRMPDELEGGERDGVGRAGAEADVDDAWAGLSYSEGRTSLVVSDGRFEGVPASESDAQAKLAAMFGLVFGCEGDTYEGSIDLQGDGPGLGDVDAGTPAWFACRIDGAEGDDDFTGHAVGWTSTTDIAWLVVGDDELSVRAMVEAMREAAR